MSDSPVLPQALPLTVAPLTMTTPPLTSETASGARVIVPLTGSRALAFIAGYFGMWVAFFAPIIIAVPDKVERLSPGNKTSALSMILAGSAIFGIIAPPIAGRLSDRCTSRFGRRRPYLVGAMVLGLIGLVGDALAPSVVIFFITFSLGAIAFGVAVAVVLSVLPEHVPRDRRGKVSGYLGIAQSLATVVGVGLTGALAPTSLAAAFIVPGVIGAVFVGWLVAVLPDRAITAQERPLMSWRVMLGSFWINPRQHRDFGWAWLSRFGIFMAFAATVNYQVFFLRDQLHIPEARSSALAAAGTGVQVVMVVVSSWVAGVLSDRLERRRVFAVVAALFGAAGLLLVAVAPGLGLFFVGLAVVGLAQGAYYAVDLALVTDILPKDSTDDARNLGVFSLANQVPTSFAPAIAPIFLAIGFGASASGNNYTALFVASAAFAVFGAVTIARVKTVR